ncbi:MAG: ATP-binding protein [Balneolaceae bacterium]
MNRSVFKRKILSVSLRIAIPSAFCITLFLFVAFWFLTDLSPGEIGVAGIISFLLCICFVVLFSQKLIKKRIMFLNRIANNISRKRFEDYENIEHKQKDELDYLIVQSVRASKTVEREIQRLNKIENYRKEFIGDISHELKTPTFAIQGFIETLLNGALNDEEVNELFLKKAMRNVNRLIYLTKDLMEISKLETGELKSNLQEMYLRDVVLDVVESLQHKAQKEDVEIRVNDFDKNLQVRADRNQIKQVLINLIENGIKYNRPNGFVEIGIKSYKNDSGKLILYIKDSGIGIDAKDLTRVTERFFRVDKSRSREKGGTGLGLSIVKHIMEAHGEELFIESNAREGSTFSFTLTRVSHVSV